jgi:hypothetical protein
VKQTDVEVTSTVFLLAPGRVPIMPISAARNSLPAGDPAASPA